MTILRALATPSKRIMNEDNYSDIVAWYAKTGLLTYIRGTQDG